jgi:hypothetical protein
MSARGHRDNTHPLFHFHLRKIVGSAIHHVVVGNLQHAMLVGNLLLVITPPLLH